MYGVCCRICEIWGAVAVWSILQEFLRLLEVADHELIRLPESRTLERLLSEVCAVYSHTTLLFVCSLRSVGLAEALDQLRICHGSCAKHLSSVVIQISDAVVIGKAGTKFIDLIKVEVASSDHPVKSAIHTLYLSCGRTDVPLPDISVCIRVTLYCMHHICLNVRKKSKIAAIKGTAHVCRIYSRKDLLGILEGLHRL